MHNEGGIVITMGVQLNMTDILSTASDLIDQARLRQIQQSVANNCSNLFTKLIEDGVVSEQELLELLSERLRLRRVSLFSYRPSAEVLALIYRLRRRKA